MVHTQPESTHLRTGKARRRMFPSLFFSNSMRKVPVLASHCKTFLGSYGQSNFQIVQSNLKWSFNHFVSSASKFLSAVLGARARNQLDRMQQFGDEANTSETDTMLYWRGGISGSLRILLAAWATFDIPKIVAKMNIHYWTFTAIIDFTSIEILEIRVSPSSSQSKTNHVLSSW